MEQEDQSEGLRKRRDIKGKELPGSFSSVTGGFSARLRDSVRDERIYGLGVARPKITGDIELKFAPNLVHIARRKTMAVRLFSPG